MTIDENLEQFNYFITIIESTFFSNTKKDESDLITIFQADLNEYMLMRHLPVQNFECFNPKNDDALATAIKGSIMKNIISLNKEKVNLNLLTLYLGSISQKYLNWILDAESGKHQGRDEFCYNDGEIVVVDENDVSTNKSNRSIQDIKTHLAEGVLIAASQLPKVKKSISRTGVYYSRGNSNKTTRETIDSDKLKKFAKSQKVISNLDKNKFSEYINSGILKKWDFLKFVDKGMISEDIAIDLMLEEILTPSEVYSKDFHIKSEDEILKSDKITFYQKLLLYSCGKLKIKEWENAIESEKKNNKVTKDEDNITLSKDDISKVAKYYKENINKISELLTHNILDFNSSMTFLDGLVREGCITDEQKEYLVNIMNDFKTKELLNGTENQRFGSSGNGIVRSKFHTNGVTIDPNLRKRYFESIGDVKEIFINGDRLISDELDGSSEKNSLDGYQLIIIPDKKIAILEKFYEVTRNQEGRLEYKTDKNGNRIAATENATYIMPIAMAKDFAEKKNKHQLMTSPYVARTLHSMNWVKNTENAMKNVACRASLDIEFDRENTDKWAKKVLDNYNKLREKRLNDIDELI